MCYWNVDEYYYECADLSTNLKETKTMNLHIRTMIRAQSWLDRGQELLWLEKEPAYEHKWLRVVGRLLLIKAALEPLVDRDPPPLAVIIAAQRELKRISRVMRLKEPRSKAIPPQGEQS